RQGRGEREDLRRLQAVRGGLRLGGHLHHAREREGGLLGGARLRAERVGAVGVFARWGRCYPQILFSGYSMMPTAPARSRRGIRSRTVASAMTDSTANHSLL